jgi:cyclase
MKKSILPKVFICLMVSFGMPAWASAQQQEVEPVRLEKISENLYQILGGRGANGGCFAGENAVLVIDAKMNQESVEQTVAAIKDVTSAPVKYLVNTHSDGDHVYGNRFFPENVVIIAHENCRKEFFHPLRDGAQPEWNEPELAPFVPELTFTRKMNMHLDDTTVELWYFGTGHTTGDIVVYFPEARTAFIGDQIFAGRPQLIHAYKGGNSFAHVKTLSRMLETLNAETFCSGHSDPLTRDDIQQHINAMKEMQQNITALVKKGLNLQEIQKRFEDNQNRLVDVIYNEIKKQSL